MGKLFIAAEVFHSPGSFEELKKIKGKKVVVDTLGVKDRVKRAQQVISFGVAFVELHAGLNEQALPGYSVLDFN